MRTARVYQREPDPMTGSRHPDDPGDAAALAVYAEALAAGVEAALPGWVDRSIRGVLAAQGLAMDDSAEAAIAAAVATTCDEGIPRLRALLAADVDDQRTNPLSVLRSLVPHLTAVLRSAGARPVDRDEFSVRSFPDDDYDLTPASFADVDPSLHEPGLEWGAAKAHVHLTRRRRQGMR
jgi:hypothetical protein